MEINIEKEVSLFVMKTFNVLSNLAFKGLGLKCESVYCETLQGNQLCMECDLKDSAEVKKMCEDIKSINMVSATLMAACFRNSLEVLQDISKETLHYSAVVANNLKDEILNFQEKKAAQ